MLHAKVKNFSICIVGWYFYNACFDYMKTDSRAFVVAHRYDPILDQMPSVLIENIGLEFHCYSWYLDNKWNGLDRVLFTHDDCRYNEGTVEEIAYNSLSQDISSFGIGGGRCLVMSPEALKFWQSHGGIFYDETNTGQTSGKTPKGVWYNLAAFHMEKMWEQMQESGFTFKKGMGARGLKTPKRGNL